MSEQIVVGAVGVVVGGALTYLLTRPPGIPADLQQILDQFSVEVHIYEGTINERHYTIPQINPKYGQVKILNYLPKTAYDLVDSVPSGEYRDTFVLGIEDLGIFPDGTEHPEERDDWKDFIVSIRRKITTNEILVTFQTSYSHAIIRDASGNIVYDTLTSPERLIVLAFPVATALARRPRGFLQRLCVPAS